jgi:SAM-dependent methyltransferase
MIAAARRVAEQRGVGHIDFETLAEFESHARTFDFVCCFHLLQRLRPLEGEALLAGLMRRLASGGIGVFHVPYRTTASPGLRALRWAREHGPLVNGMANQLRGKRWNDPHIPAHTYGLDRILSLLDAASAGAVHVVFEHQEELSSAILFVERPLPSITGVDQHGRRLPGIALRLHEPKDRDRPLDVKTLIERTSIEALNQSAEEYFSSLTDWDDHLAKPFSTAGDAPRLLLNLSTLLHGLRFKSGTTVLEFGAGTGWLSRQITQLGGRAILLDVSPTALDIARELYRRQPVAGRRPAPEFLLFDGRRIDLPDASVDRIISFDAFHHVPNPDDVLREFGRVLKPCGIAAFAEPGARHSRSPMSQFEMRTYGVVENDIDVHQLWRAAQQCGFSDLQIAIFNGPPFYVSLAEYEDFLAAGPTGERWLTATRVFQRDVRNFFLFKAGSEPLDSRAADGLAATIEVSVGSGDLVEGQPIGLDVTVTNSGQARWLPADAQDGGVRLGAHLYGPSGRMLTLDFHTEPLTDPPRPIEPGETVKRRMTLPALAAGQYQLEVDCVASHVAWFGQAGSKTATVRIDVRTQGPHPSVLHA